MIRETRQLLADVVENGAEVLQGVALRDVDANIAAGHRTIAPEFDVFLLEVASLFQAVAAKLAPR